eukprot:m.150580 g.150580  ORF g.150580 m.150580 type:complete len:218 (-) comp52800_c0_seq2:866-1519(-)
MACCMSSTPGFFLPDGTRLISSDLSTALSVCSLMAPTPPPVRYYYKHGPHNSDVVLEEAELGAVKGSIAMALDSTHVMRWDECNQYLEQRHDKLQKRKTLFQNIEWPSEANEDNSLGIRTDDRVWFLYAPTGSIAHWCAALKTHLRPAAKDLASTAPSDARPLIDARAESIAPQSAPAVRRSQPADWYSGSESDSDNLQDDSDKRSASTSSITSTCS